MRVHTFGQGAPVVKIPAVVADINPNQGTIRAVNRGNRRQAVRTGNRVDELVQTGMKIFDRVAQLWWGVAVNLWQRRIGERQIPDIAAIAFALSIQICRRSQHKRAEIPADKTWQVVHGHLQLWRCVRNGCGCGCICLGLTQGYDPGPDCIHLIRGHLWPQRHTPARDRKIKRRAVRIARFHGRGITPQVNDVMHRKDLFIALARAVTCAAALIHHTISRVFNFQRDTGRGGFCGHGLDHSCFGRVADIHHLLHQPFAAGFLGNGFYHFLGLNHLGCGFRLWHRRGFSRQSDNRKCPRIDRLFRQISKQGSAIFSRQVAGGLHNAAHRGGGNRATVQLFAFDQHAMGKGGCIHIGQARWRNIWRVIAKIPQIPLVTTVQIHRKAFARRVTFAAMAQGLCQIFTALVLRVARFGQWRAIHRLQIKRHFAKSVHLMWF